MAIGNVELVDECCSKHLCMGTARMKEDKSNEKKESRVNVEISILGTKEKRIPDGQLHASRGLNEPVGCGWRTILRCCLCKL